VRTSRIPARQRMSGVGSGGAYPDVLCFKAPSAPENHHSAESAICPFRKAQAPRPWSHCVVPGVMRPTAVGSSQSLVRLIEENDTENDQGGSWQLSAAVLGPGENIWTFGKSNRIGCVAACPAGFAGTPVTGRLLHFPVLPVATPLWAGPDVPGPAKRPVSGLSVARRARVAKLVGSG
jgi:hypothetical protein